jgi:tetratricopeptide (TPR) repeat protein
VAWRRASKEAALASLVPLLVFAVVHTGGWVVLNTSRDASYSRIKKSVQSDMHYSKDYYQGYRNKSWTTITYNKYNDLKETIRAAEERYRADPADSANTPQLAGVYLTVGDTLKAVELAMDNWMKFLDSPGVISSLGTTLLGANRTPEAKEIYQAYMAGGGTYFRILHDLGVIFERNGEMDSAFQLYDLAYRSWPSAPAAAELLFYLSIIRHGYKTMAADGLRRISPKFSPSIRTVLGDLLEVLPGDDKRRIDSLTITLCKRVGIQPASLK